MGEDGSRKQEIESYMIIEELYAILDQSGAIYRHRWCILIMIPSHILL